MIKRIFRKRRIDWALRHSGKVILINNDWKIGASELAEIEILYPLEYECFEAETWLEILLLEFQNCVSVKFVNLNQPYAGIVLLQIIKNGKPHDVIIDYSDYPEINVEAAERAAVYFKMQYSIEDYGIENVLPGGYVTDSWRLYRSLRKMQRLRDGRNFQHQVCGRFGLDYATEIRSQAVEILKKQNKFQFSGGLKKVGFEDFLRETAESKIVIDLPGNGAFCHRLVNYLAVGACVVAYPHESRLHVPLENGKHIALVNKDFSDLVETCEFYLKNEAAREAMCAVSREYFEKNLHTANLANYYLRSCLNRI